MNTLTAPKLGDILDVVELAVMVKSKYVKRQVHPTEPLAILNYTEMAAYDGVWNQATLACRGLIYNTETDEVVARPFRKFFNHGQAGAPALGLDEPVTVSDKLDGSLGILYPLPSECPCGRAHPCDDPKYAIATRGSFTSEQALHATEVWQRRYADRARLMPTHTFLFEIVYPTNRIVIDYGDMDDLVLLGAVDIATGRSLRRPEWYRGWPGPAAETFLYWTLADALQAPPRPNREGLVVHFTRTDERVKLKQADYVALHRIVTGLSERTVWEHLVADRPLDELIEPLPDEFHEWVVLVAARLTAAVDTEHARLLREHRRLEDQMPPLTFLGTREGRKEFAALASIHPDRWAMFALLDGKNIRPELLKRAKPEAFATPAGRTYTEDTA